jgi:hypothetical protein
MLSEAAKDDCEMSRSVIQVSILYITVPATLAACLICGQRQRFLRCGHLTFRSTGLPAVNQNLPQPLEPLDEATSPLACVIDRIRPEVHQTSNCRKRRTMFLGLGFVLLLLWLGGFFVVFHVTAFFIHILLILAVVSIIFHFMRGAASTV